MRQLKMDITPGVCRACRARLPADRRPNRLYCDINCQGRASQNVANARRALAVRVMAYMEQHTPGSLAAIVHILEAKQ